MNAIEAKGLTKRFGPKTAVNRLELTVPEGELYALILDHADASTYGEALASIRGSQPHLGRKLLKVRGIVQQALHVGCVGEGCICPLACCGLL